MVYAEMSDGLANYENEYYLVFTDGIRFYASYPIFFKAEYASQDLYFDLGYSMAGKTFYGAYLTASFENKDTRLGISQNGELSYSRAEDEVGRSPTVEEVLLKLTNRKNNLFDLGKVSLANRIQLLYGDINVDYDLYKGNITDLTVNGSTLTIDTIYQHTPLASFERNDGSKDDTENFNVKYYFAPSIDINVEHQASEKGNYIELEVNKEYTSIAELFNIHHPTTSNKISSSDFATGSTKLNFKIVNYNTTTGGNAVINKYSILTTKFNIYAGDDANNVYLLPSEVRNSSKNVCDYYIRPLGAKNTGDYVLGLITYSAGGFTKEFYVVIKIIPDYLVSFDGNPEVSTEPDGTVSNVDSIYAKALDTKDEENNDIVLTGDSSNVGVVSVKHKNGDADVTSVELSSTRFTITMPIGVSYEDTTYNNETNLETKIFYSGNIGVDDKNKNWSKDTSTNPKSYKVASGNIAKLENIKHVIFADQYYMIKAVDPYGYTYKFYFALESERTPVVNGTVSLLEDTYFDVGLQYELLSITAQGESGKENYNINSIPTMPIAPENVTMVNIEGIEAWLFDKDYTIAEEGTPYLKAADNGYVANTGVSFDKSQEDYLTAPKFKDITIESINFYEPNNLSNKIEEVTKPTVKTSAFATSDVLLGQFKTGEGNSTQGDEGDTRPAINRGPYTVSGDTANTDGLWKVPRLTNTDIYKGSTTAEITMIITLKYYKTETDNGTTSTTTEYYDLPVKVSLSRALNIEENEDTKIARDAQAIDMSTQFNKINDETTTSFINDTLEVLVAANSSASFEMTYKGKTVAVQISNASTGYPKTYYISLSEYFNKNIEKSERVVVKNISENVLGLYYITEKYKQGNIIPLDQTFTLNSEEDYTLNIIDKMFESSSTYNVYHIRDGIEIESKGSIWRNNIEKLSEFLTNEIQSGDQLRIYSPYAICTIDGLNPKISEYCFYVSQVEEDYIYIENASLLYPNDYYNVEKHYIMQCKIGGNTYSYRVSRNYIVTGYYYQLENQYALAGNSVGFTMNPDILIVEEDGTIAYPNAKVLIENWQDGSFKLKEAAYKDGAVSKATEIDKLDYVSYRIEKSGSELAGLTVGSATIDDSGTITLGETFNENQYIKVALDMPVSGTDRILGNGDASETLHNLGTLDLTTVRKDVEVSVPTILARWPIINQKFDFNVTEGYQGSILKIDNTLVSSNQISYINNTLEVLVNEGDLVSFDLALKRGEKTIVTKSLSLSLLDSITGNERYPVSLSKTFGQLIKENDKVIISNVNSKDNKTVEFYYTNSDTTVENQGLIYTYSAAASSYEFSIEAITEDYCFVSDNAEFLSESTSGKYPKKNILNKYYLAYCYTDSYKTTLSTIVYITLPLGVNLFNNETI